jgi:hypothetical protein
MKKRTTGTRPKSRSKPIPIYTTRGDWAALMVFPHIYNPVGEWIGWVTPDRQVYDVDGRYVGWLTDEPRVLRSRAIDKIPEPKAPPPPAGNVRPPATVPLPPMMRELTYDTIDVFEDEPERLHTTDSGELKEDMD